MSGYFDSLNRRLRTVPAVAVRESARTVVALRPLRPRPAPRAYEQLRERLMALADGHPLQTLVFAGCAGSEGCSEVVREFAESLASSGLNVLLVDADPRGGLATTDSGVPDLTELVAEMRTPQPVAWGKGKLTFVSSPNSTSDKERFLRGPEFAAWLAAQRDAYDYTLLDAPPLLRFADGTMLARLADGVAIVAGAERTQGRALSRAREQLERSGARVLGVVLNRVRDPIPARLRPYFTFLTRDT